jgi:hypothetical protein
MEKRTRILLGRSVKRRDAREKVRDAYARAKLMPQGRGYVALEEALAEARAVGADAGEGETMLEEIRQEARAAEAAALAAALQAACLQVPVDVAGLRANLQRARGVLEREEQLAAALSVELAVATAAIAGAAETDGGEEGAALINMAYNDTVYPWDAARTAEAAAAWTASAAYADQLLSSDEHDASTSTTFRSFDSDDEVDADTDADPEVDSMGWSDDDEGGGGTGTGAAGSVLGSMEDIDRFTTDDGAGADDGDDDAGSTSSTLRTAIAAAEAALEAAELEADLRTTLQDEASLNVASVPKLETLMLRAAKVAESRPTLTQEGAAKLNTLVSRCFSRATALQEMEGARAALAEALEPSLAGRDLCVGGVGLDAEAVPRLEKAVARARGAAWPWQLESAAAGAEKVLERWRAMGAVEAAMASRSVPRLRAALTASRRDHPTVDTRQAEKLLSELDAERALEGGDQRLKVYFGASKVAWAGGAITTEAAAMLATIRQSLDITEAEHEQVTRAATRNPEPQILNSKPYTLNLKP